MNMPNPHSWGNVVGKISPFSGEMLLWLSKTTELNQGHFS